jgi:hypothetical protein
MSSTISNGAAGGSDAVARMQFAKCGRMTLLDRDRVWCVIGSMNCRGVALT